MFSDFLGHETLQLFVLPYAVHCFVDCRLEGLLWAFILSGGRGPLMKRFMVQVFIVNRLNEPADQAISVELFHVFTTVARKHDRLPSSENSHAQAKFVCDLLYI